jgi:hypothetical protein
MESSLWRPFGGRTVVDLVDLAPAIPPNIHWVLVRNGVVTNRFRSFDQWMFSTGGTLVSSQMVSSTMQAGAERWSLVHFTASAQNDGQRIRSLGSPSFPATPD